MIYSILFGGKSFPYYPVSQPVKIGVLFGFIKEEEEQAGIANRIFETFFYDLLLAEDILESKTYDTALQSRNQFVKNGILDMELIRYPEDYHLKKGYLLSFCFHQKKKIGKNVIQKEGNTIVEVVV